MLLSGPVMAQDTVYTQMGLWDVPRAKWSQFVAFYEKYEKPVMEQLVADGVLVEIGFEANGLHDPEDYSHASWMSAHSLADLEKALNAYYDSLGSDADRVEEEFAGLVSKHKDIVVFSHFYGSNTVKLDDAYSFGSSVRVKRGHGSEYRRLWKEWAKPIFDQLLADGTIVAYTVDEAYHHTDADFLGRIWVWYVVDDIANEAKVTAAFDAAREALSETERESRLNLYWGLIVEESHRDGFSRLIHFQTR
jgi:hypothetical protein